jgi:hypothetical protein
VVLQKNSCGLLKVVLMARNWEIREYISGMGMVHENFLIAEVYSIER